LVRIKKDPSDYAKIQVLIIDFIEVLLSAYLVIIADFNHLADIENITVLAIQNQIKLR